jgi:hypothetical protein
MKKLLIGLIFAFSYNLGATENANIIPIGPNAVGGYLANETALAYDKHYTYDLSQYGIDKISAIVEYGSATVITAQTFTDGSVSTATIQLPNYLSTTTVRGLRIVIDDVCLAFGTKKDMPSQSCVAVATKYTPIGMEGCHDNMIIAINTHPILSKIITASACGSVGSLVSPFCLTSKYGDGKPYSIVVDKPFIADKHMFGGVATTWNVSTDKITIQSHNYDTGLPLLLTGRDTIGGLMPNATYYAIKTDENNIKLATSKIDAIAGTAIDLYFPPMYTSNSWTHTLTPLAVSGTPSFKWRFSNDATNFFDVNITSITMNNYTYPYASVAYDFDVINYRYIDLDVIAPTDGGVFLKSIVYGKK